nr:unnamed protein product [Callosobruchus analis]
MEKACVTLGSNTTATIRENRLSKCPLESSKILSEKPRGAFDFLFDTDHELLVANNIVNMITDYNSVEPLHNAKRWSGKEKKLSEVSKPQLFKICAKGREELI